MPLPPAQPEQERSAPSSGTGRAARPTVQAIRNFAGTYLWRNPKESIDLANDFIEAAVFPEFNSLDEKARNMFKSAFVYGYFLGTANADRAAQERTPEVK